METRGAASEESGRFELCAAETEVRRGSLTHEELAAAAAQHRMIQPKLLPTRSRFKAKAALCKESVNVCRVSVQNARSLKFSETCNAKRREIHRLFHSFCGKVVGNLSSKEKETERKLTWRGKHR